MALLGEEGVLDTRGRAHSCWDAFKLCAAAAPDAKVAAACGSRAIEHAAIAEGAAGESVRRMQVCVREPKAAPPAAAALRRALATGDAGRQKKRESSSGSGTAAIWTTPLRSVPPCRKS